MIARVVSLPYRQEPLSGWRNGGLTDMGLGGGGRGRGESIKFS